MLRTSTVFACLVSCVIALVATTSNAGLLVGNPLAYNDGNGPFAGAWSGTAPFVNGGLVGTVDWAVFEDTDFSSIPGVAGYAPPAGEFVYAYQIFTTGPQIGASGMDIPLDGFPAGNAGSFTATGIGGVPTSFAFADQSLATFILATETDPLTPSDGLAYASPNPPQLTGIPTVVDGGTSATTIVAVAIPGQIPEPAALLTASIATLAWSMFRRTRRD
jgi:hypothetical protein